MKLTFCDSLIDLVSVFMCRNEMLLFDSVFVVIFTCNTVCTVCKENEFYLSILVFSIMGNKPSHNNVKTS